MRRSLHEELDFDVQDEMMHELYRAISKAMFKFRRYYVTKNDFESIMDQVVYRFCDGEDFDFDEE